MTVINTKTPSEQAKMRRAGKVVAEALELVKNEAKPGVTTAELNDMVEGLFRERDAKPAFKGYRGFPAAICTSVNEQVVHGIPGKYVLKDGDLLSVDVGCFVDEYAGDAAISVPVGQCDEDVLALLKATRESLEAGLMAIRGGVRIAEISRAIQNYAEGKGYSVVRQYTGHGIGRSMHEPPEIPNFVSSKWFDRSPRLSVGAAIAVEPMLNAGSHEVEVLDDGWTVVTKDRKLSAHFEHTVVVGEDGPILMTVR
jgi:methionyl aminopeptidase